MFLISRLKRIPLLVYASLGIAVPICLIFFLIPGAIEFFSFSGSTFFAGEIWRLISFPFVHINQSHLIENLAALVLISVLAFEFGLREKQFIGFFVLTSVAIALLSGLLVPVLVIAGASMGIYGVLGSLSVKGSRYISKYILIPLFGLSIFLLYFYQALACPGCITQKEAIQAVFHLSGYVAGIAFFYILIKAIKKPKIRNFDFEI